MSNTKLPALPGNVSHVMRRIRACESEVPAQIVLEHALHAYAEAAILADRERQAGEAVAWHVNHNGSCQIYTSLEGLDLDGCTVTPLFASLPAPQAVQAGWKLVPVEPTTEMLAAILEPIKWAGGNDAYQSMLAAAPSPDGKAEKIAGTWESVGKNDTMRHPEESDLIGGETDMPSKAEQAEAPSTLADYHREQYEQAHAGWEACKQECDRLRDELVGKAMTPDEKRDRFARDNWAALTGAKFPDGATLPTASNAGERLSNPEDEVAFLNLQIGKALEEMGCCNFNSAAERLRLSIDPARAALATKPPAGEQKPVGTHLSTLMELNAYRAGLYGLCQGPEPSSLEEALTHLRNRLHRKALVAQPEQVAQDKIDAERYRWLRDNNDDWEPFDGRWLSRVGCYGDDGPAMDAAIDAARARGEGGGNA